MPKYSWTQPICDECFEAKYPDSNPPRFKEEMRELEICCICCEENRSGIYTRIDPATVACPTRADRG
jgi:hypothetical protein